MGHSMGSFIVRLAAEKYVNPDKLIVMGTGGANPASGAGIALCSLVALFKGDRHISKFIDKMAFGGYNNKFKGDADASSKSWLTTDQSIRNKYLEDNYCTFKFTVSAMGDLMTLLKNCNRGAWFREMAKKTSPILLVAGEDDPVGNYGKGVCQVEEKLKKHGAKVECILYKGGRHEILNDVMYERVREDIIEFCLK
jgi:alpha-beta hydrolase superfamily lysophospholipase